MTEPASYRTYQHFIGVDPGPIPGIVVLTPWDNGELAADVIQCSQGIASTLIDNLLREYHEHDQDALVAVERFVVGRGSMRAAGAGEQTRDLIGQIQRVVSFRSTSAFVKRSASAVKPWATDLRLDAAGLLEATKGMRHARDAARHALFAAVRDGGLPDPLSRKAWPR